MSDSNNSVSFNDYLKLNYTESQAESCYHTANAEAQRAMAVSCALELMRAKLLNGETTHVEYALQSLSDNADLIQEALKVNNK